MAFVSVTQNPATLGEKLHDALAVTPSLIADIIRDACRRFPSDGRTGKTVRIEQLIKMGAWTDAALALIELELPQWQVRRLAYDDGEWYCALSRERELPDWLDDSVEGRHADLALAILSAFVEVPRTNTWSSRPDMPAAGRNDGALYVPLCCDSFS
jgi:hypothetical protein